MLALRKLAKKHVLKNRYAANIEGYCQNHGTTSMTTKMCIKCQQKQAPAKVLSRISKKVLTLNCLFSVVDILDVPFYNCKNSELNKFPRYL